MKYLGKMALATGATAMLAATPLPVMAAGIADRVETIRSGDVMQQSADGHRRRWHRHDRVDAGDILTGIGILAGIAIIAGAASDADKRERNEPRYDDRDYDNRDDRPAYQDNDVGSAVSVCSDAAERSAGDGARVREIRSVTRDGTAWRVEGDLDSGSAGSFDCAATDGRVDYIRLDDREA